LFLQRARSRPAGFFSSTSTRSDVKRVIAQGAQLLKASAKQCHHQVASK